MIRGTGERGDIYWSLVHYMEAPVSKLLVEIDDEALSNAAAILGTTTKKDTVNSALAEVAKRHSRALALAELREMAAQGDFDTLLDKRVYRR